MDSGLHMKYFVLKPKGDDAYARASRMAMSVFAKKIKEDNPKLANDLENWVTEAALDTHWPIGKNGKNDRIR